MSSPKKLGCCSLCDKEVFEVIRRASRDCSFPRMILQVGKPLPEARRATVLLTGGSTMDLTLCGECKLDAESLVEVWARVRAGWAQEGCNSYRKRYTKELNNGTIPDLTLAQQWTTGRNQLDIAKQIPIGVLYEQSWQEVV